MSTQLRLALEQALVENPDDLAAHAAYADLLMEEGDPRGEFIQVQLALENEDLPWEQKKPLQQRARDILQAHGEEWRRPIKEILGDQLEDDDIKFSRGWISELFSLRVSDEEAARLVKLPDLRLLRKLQIADSERGKEPRRPPPAQSHLRNVQEFQLGLDRKHSSADGDGPVAPYLVASMPRLRKLALYCREPEARLIFGLPSLTQLRVLRYERGTSYPLAVLADNSALVRLRSLVCIPRPTSYSSGAYIGLDDLVAVVHSVNLRRLTHLCLRMSDFGDAGCEEIVSSGIMQRLQRLDLSHGTITDEGAQLLAEWPDTANLESLNLSANALTEAGIEILQARLPDVQLRTDSQHGPGDTDYLQDGDWE